MERQVHASSLNSTESSAQFELDLKSMSYLADHCVANTCVAAGAALIVEPLVHTRELTDIEFHHMIPLTAASKTVVDIQHSGTSVIFKDAENQTEYVSAKSVQSNEIAPWQNNAQDLHQTIEGSALYSRLDSQGNNYGPHFQCIQKVAFNEKVGTADWKLMEPASGNQTLAILIDGMTHVLATVSGISSLYYLRSIASIQLFHFGETPAEAVIACKIESESQDSYTASFEITDTGGSRLLSATGVTIAASATNAGIERIALTGTFTLDPMAEVFEMWSKRLGFAIQPKFADYGQVFQTLLQSNDTFNDSAASLACLVRLEDWAGNDRKLDLLSPESLDTHFSKEERYELPDGRTIAQLNKYETAYLYREIFVDLTYKRHGVIVQDKDVVIDIGANIGLFTLFVSTQAEDVKVFSIEPSPAVLPILRANVAAYAPSTQVIAAGASDAIGEAEFTAYKNSSVFSGFSADSSDDKEAISMIIRNTLIASGQLDESLVEQAVDEMMTDRMDAENYVCPLISVSDVIEQNGIEQIGLLKIDAEKSEDAVIAGIKEEHWPMIQQVIIEVHKQSGSEVDDVVEMLGRRGFDCIEDEETLLTDSGLVTIYAVRPDRAATNKQLLPQTAVAEAGALFTEAVDTFQQQTSKKLDIILCPSTTRDPALQLVINEVEKNMVEHFATSNAVNAQVWSDFCRQYPVAEIADDVGNQLGHIPYTKSWYAATTTALVRQHVSAKRTPYKVLVLDCDNTLWNGIVGEAGVNGIQFDEGSLALQGFAKNLSAQGMLICLASKNDEAAVKEVFEQRSADMALQWSDITTHRINWDRKSDSLVSMANELDLGLDSFVFLDDSAIECGEVRSIVPQVLTLQMPEAASEVSTFLNHTWAFDSSSTTAEDAKRTQRYQEEKKRKDFATTTTSIEDFIAGLRLEYKILPVESDQIARASQMTMRTNQFNMSTVRRSESEIQDLINQGWTCEYVTVADRFGDYGITGLAIYFDNGSKIEVDTMLLSCRILGRGIEHALARHIGQQAQREQVVFKFAKTARNQPAIDFLNSVSNGSAAADDEAGEIDMSAQVLSVLEYKPVAQVQTDSKSSTKTASLAAAPFDLVEQIASQFNDAEEIARIAADRARIKRPDLEQTYVAPRNDIETQVAEIWCELLGFTEVGVEDDFFKLGGTSLKGVEVISRIKSELNANVTVVNVFEQATIAHLASIISSGGAASTASVEGKSRGDARRKARSRRNVRAK